MNEAAVHPDIRIQDLHSAIIAALNAVGYLTAQIAHDALTFDRTIGAEDRKNAETGETFNASREIRDRNTERLWATLRAVSVVMEELGDHQEEPSGADMEAVNPTFGLIHRLLGTGRWCGEDGED